MTLYVCMYIHWCVCVCVCVCVSVCECVFVKVSVSLFVCNGSAHLNPSTLDVTESHVRKSFESESVDSKYCIKLNKTPSPFFDVFFGCYIAMIKCNLTNIVYILAIVVIPQTNRNFLSTSCSGIKIYPKWAQGKCKALTENTPL